MAAAIARGVVPVDIGEHVPAVRGEALGRVVPEPAFDLAVDADAVVVVERDELAQAQGARERARLVRDAFHEAAVAEEDVREVIDDRVSRAIELAGQQALGEREAHRVGEPLAQRARRGFHAGRVADFRVPGRARVELAEAAQLLHRQVVAR
jgi:hypothetical protein